MRINGSAVLTAEALYGIAAGNARVAELYARNSRSSAVGWDVYLAGSASHRGRAGNADYPAAMWDEWGMFLAGVFATDPGASVPGVYASAEVFAEVTCERFGSWERRLASHVFTPLWHFTPALTFTGPADWKAPHKRRGHRWDDYQRLVTGVVQWRCSVDGCTAARRPIPAPVRSNALVSARSAGVLS